MFRHRVSSLTLTLALFQALSGSSAAEPAGDGAPLSSPDRELARMSREIPGFGGLRYDERGRPHVFLLDPSGAGRAALKRLGGEVVVERGDFAFESLLDWRRSLRPILSLPGIVYLDVDEAQNRVVVGLDSSARSKSADRQRLEERIVEAGVPRRAVLLRETAHFVPLAGLRDKLRPVPGGVQMVFSSFICTLGFSAVRGRDTGFIVASHCTDLFAELEGTRFFQNLAGSASRIGTEIADPGFSTEPPCPPGRRCRFSDSAFAKYDKAKLGGLGKIARPVSSSRTLGSIILNPASARFTITGRGSAPLAGEVVHKVGRSTGWTFGTVFGTCVDVNVEPDLTFLCQSMVQIGGGPGDSGSPVFSVLPGNKARLTGLLWGGGDDPELGTVGLFSPLANLEADLGPLKVN